MRKMKKRMMCAVLSLLMIITALPVTASDAAAKTTVDPEVKRAVTLGLVDSSYLKKPNKAATTQELENMIVKIMKKKGASAAKVKSFKKLAKGSKKHTARAADTAMAVYYAARYMTKDKTPRMNTAMQSGRWLPADWDAAMDYIDTYDNNQALIRGKSGTFKVYNSEAGWFSGEGLQTYDVNIIPAAIYVAGLSSRYSGQYVLPNASDGKLYLNKKLTRAKLALQMVRYYDSFEKEAKYVSIESLGKKNVISDATIAKAKAVPEVDSTGASDSYVGTCLQNYCEPGIDGSLHFVDNRTYNYCETDFMSMADMGINYVRLTVTCNSYAYPAYSRDRTKLNETIVKDVDNAIKWCMKYGIHASLSMMGWVDDDLDGLGAELVDGAKKNEITPACLAPDESWELKTRLVKAFAKRYSNVPAKYLSFELECENSAEPWTVDGVRTLTHDEMADKYIEMAESIWNVTPERGVSLSTCDTLDEKSIDYWTKIAKAGINLDYHCYEPRAFVAMQPGRKVDADAMVWPNFVDENGEAWDMEKVYQVYLKPWQELADQYNVNLKLGENGIFVEGDMLSEPVYRQKYVLAWVKDFTSTMKKHNLSYVLGHYTAIATGVHVILPEENDYGGYLIDAKYTKKTYTNGKYKMTYYLNKPLVKAALGG